MDELLVGAHSGVSILLALFSVWRHVPYRARRVMARLNVVLVVGTGIGPGVYLLAIEQAGLLILPYFLAWLLVLAGAVLVLRSLPGRHQARGVV